MPYTVVEYERDAERFCQALAQVCYRYRSGRSPTLDAQPVFDSWSHLFGLDLIEQLGQEPIEASRRHALVTFAVRGRFQQAGLRELQHLAAAEASATVVFEEQAIPLRAVPGWLANFADAGRRHRLDEARRQVVAAENGARRSLLERWFAVHDEVGQPDPVRFWDRLGDLDLEQVSALAERYLEETEQRYRDTLASALRLDGLELDDAWQVDLGWLGRSAEFDAAFPWREAVPTARRLLLRLGQRFEEQSAITLETASPGAPLDSFCAALHIPLEIKVVVVPRGGWGDYATLLDLLGQAEHLANMDPALTPAYRWLGDQASVLGSGALLASLLRVPTWLASATDLGDPSDFLQRARLAHWARTRADAALLGYEQAVLRAPADDWEMLEDRYVRSLGRALAVRCDSEDFLRVVAEPFAATRRYRAALFGAQLRAYLEREFDEEWYRSPRVGKFLVELWREGTRYTARELLRFMGYEGFAVEPLLAQE